MTLTLTLFGLIFREAMLVNLEMMPPRQYCPAARCLMMASTNSPRSASTGARKMTEAQSIS